MYGHKLLKTINTWYTSLFNVQAEKRQPPLSEIVGDWSPNPRIGRRHWSHLSVSIIRREKPPLITPSWWTSEISKAIFLVKCFISLVHFLSQCLCDMCVICNSYRCVTRLLKEIERITSRLIFANIKFTPTSRTNTRSMSFDWSYFLPINL